MVAEGCVSAMALDRKGRFGVGDWFLGEFHSAGTDVCLEVGVDRGVCEAVLGRSGCPCWEVRGDE